METSPSQVHSTSAVLSTLKVQSPAFTETLSMRTMWEGKKNRMYRDREEVKHDAESFIMELAIRSQDLLWNYQPFWLHFRNW